MLVSTIASYLEDVKGHERETNQQQRIDFAISAQHLRGVLQDDI